MDGLTDKQRMAIGKAVQIMRNDGLNGSADELAAIFAAPSLPAGNGLTDEQIVKLRRETDQGAHAPRASDLAFARAILAAPRQPGEVGAGVQPLGGPFASVLHDNLPKLYVEDASAQQDEREAPLPGKTQEDRMNLARTVYAISASKTEPRPERREWFDAGFKAGVADRAAQQDERELAPCIGQCGNAVNADGDRICHECAQQDEREAFEEIAKYQCLPLSRNGITYDDISTQAAWAVYQQVRANQVQADAGAVASRRMTEANFDDYVVEQFAVALKRKLADARAKGRRGWNYCDPVDLSRMLREHVEKGDPRDVANFSMFLWYHGQPIAAHPSPAAESDKRDAERFREVMDVIVAMMNERPLTPTQEWMHGMLDSMETGAITIDHVRAAIDAAMSREQSGGEASDA